MQRFSTRTGHSSFLLALTLHVCGAAACVAESSESDPEPAGLDGRDRGRWPTVRTPLPPCADTTPTFAAPVVRPPVGLVAFLPAASLEPVGYDVRIDVEIRKPGTGELDTDINGPLTVDAGVNAIIAAPPVIVAGRTHVLVRFAVPGSYELGAWLEDGRTGSVEIFAYKTQLPVWELSIDDAEFAAILANPGERRRAEAKLTLERREYAAELRLHGGSSRYYSKQSLRIDLAPGLALPDGTDRLILRSEWNDKTFLRNFLGSELLRNAIWIPTFGTEHVHLRVNQRYYGVMLHTERVDKDFLRKHGLSASASLYEADPPREVSIPGGNLTPLASRDRYPLVYQHHAGSTVYDDLVEFIERTLTLPEADFLQVSEAKIATDDLLSYIAATAVIQNHDHIRKNYYLYRDAAGDGRWRVFPWDLDLTFGHLYTDEGDTREEDIFIDESLFFGEQVAEHDFYNQLISRVLKVPTYRAEFISFVRHIAEHALTEEFVDSRIDNVLCRATWDILADTKKRSTNEEYLSRVEELKAFVRGRKAYIATQR